MNRNRFILAQGSMDGACFLYSVANAVRALTGVKRAYPQRWSDMLGGLSHVGDFLDQMVGTAKTDSRQELQVKIVKKMALALAPSVNIEVSLVPSDDLTGRRLGSLINKETVLVIGTKAHWVCAVDIDLKGRYMRVADSSQLHLADAYEEKIEGCIGRVSNNHWSAAPQKRYFNAFRLSLAKD